MSQLVLIIIASVGVYSKKKKMMKAQARKKRSSRQLKKIMKNH